MEDEKYRRYDYQLTLSYHSFIIIIIEPYLDGSYVGPNSIVKDHSRVFNVKLVNNDKEVMVYFYDIWADLMQNCEYGNIITISGPKDMVYLSERGDTVDLVVIPNDSPSKEAKVSIKYANSVLPEITISSTNILEHADKLIKRQKTSHKLLPQSPMAVPISKTGNKLLPQSPIASPPPLPPPPHQAGTPIVTREFQSLINEEVYLNLERHMLKAEGIPFETATMNKERSRQVYNYVTLHAAEQIALNKEARTQQVFIYGVIISYSLVKCCIASAANKYTATYQLVDPTRDNFENPFIVNVFANNLDFFPEVTRVGDIMRVHRANAQVYKDQVQLLANPKNNSALVTFSRHVDMLTGLAKSINSEEETDPVLRKWRISSSDNHHEQKIADFNREDFQGQIEELSNWGNEKLTKREIGKTSISLNEIQKNCYYDPQSDSVIDDKVRYADCICVVVKSVLNGTNLLCDMWDGTVPGALSATPPSIYTNDQLNSMNKTLHAARVLADTLRKSESTLEIRKRIDNAPTTPTSFIGQPVQIVYETDQSFFRGRLLATGTWIRIRNLKLRFGLDNTVIGEIDKNTSVNVLLPYHRDVQKFIATYLQRLTIAAQNNIPITSSSSSTNSNNKNIPTKVERRMYSATGVHYTPVCLCNATPAPFKFCILGKVVGFWPPLIKDFVREVPVNIDSFSSNDIDGNINGNGNVASSNGNIRRGEKMTLKFVFCLQIMDDTGEISALLFDKEAETLLGGISPEEFNKNEEIQQKVHENLNDIMQKSLSHDFFIRSYTTVDVSNKKDGKYKRYQIFNTKLL